MIVCTFAQSVLAKPLNNAQIVRGVFVYTHLNMANLIPFTKRFESSENLVNCSKYLTGVFIQNNVTSIGYYTFDGYDNLPSKIRIDITKRFGVKVF